ncbi:hypothetical protein ABZ723_09390 [Streptomyces sp. NPDC006700]|uniref:hypothetical protein n=1 Tax=unclassified Streptomyces TaxID=2593676 RepID=UPI0033D2FDC6
MEVTVAVHGAGTTPRWSLTVTVPSWPVAVPPKVVFDNAAEAGPSSVACRGKPLVIVKQSVCAGAGKESEREGGQETTVTVLAIFLLIIGTLLVLIGALLVFIGTFLIAIGMILIIAGVALIAAGTFLLIRKLLGRDRTRPRS